MSVTDPLADMITRIRNGLAAGKGEVAVPISKVKLAVCRVLQNEGYIESFEVVDRAGRPELQVSLKYYKGQPVIESIHKVSKPGRRVFKGKNDLPNVMGGFGIAIVSTSKGVVSDKEAKASGHGGEVLCVVS